MNALWKRFEEWLAINWQEGLSVLNPPATEIEIASLEETIGVSLPKGFKDCLRVHNGQSGFLGLFDGTEFLSTQEIMSQWNVWNDLLTSGDFEGIESEPQRGIRKDWWNTRWIPFTHNGGGDHLCIDLAPDLAGRAGQVITMWHDMGERELKAPSFEEWFEEYVEAVIAGEFVYSKDYGGIVSKDDA